MRFQFFRAWAICICVHSIAFVSATHAQDIEQEELAARPMMYKTAAGESIDTEAFSRAARMYQTRAPLWRILRIATGTSAPTRTVVSRARLSGLLPQVKVGARMRQGSDFLQVQSSDSGKLNLAGDEQMSIGVELQFALDRLLFSRVEPALERARRDERASWMRRRADVVATYYQWLMLVVERDIRGSVELSHHVAINEQAARLNLFTGGAFFRMMRKAGNAAGHERNSE